MKNPQIKRIMGLLLLLQLISLPRIWSEEENQPSPVVISMQIERHNNFLHEPGNIPYEILRRIGRAINKEWPTGKADIAAASIFDTKLIGKKDFLKPVLLRTLNKQQQAYAKELLSKNQVELQKLLEDCRPHKEAITVKVALSPELIKTHLEELLKSNGNNSKLTQQQVQSINEQILPTLSRADKILLAGSISVNGIFFRVAIISDNKSLYDEKTAHSLSIANIINHEPLMLFAQTFPIEDTAETMNKLKSIPQTTSVIQMIASAGMDFEKDILANAAREGVLYVNLEPTGDHGWPDIRFVAPIPDLQKFQDNLPKFRKLCTQTGIYVSPVVEKGMPMVKLSYFMFPDKAIFAALVDKFLIIASSMESITKESSHINASLQQKKLHPRSLIINQLKRHWRIRTQDLNVQLQRLLQSPMLRDKGIPPISNLTFLDDLGDLEISSSSSPELISFTFDLPIGIK